MVCKYWSPLSVNEAIAHITYAFGLVLGNSSNSRLWWIRNVKHCPVPLVPCLYLREVMQ